MADEIAITASIVEKRLQLEKANIELTVLKKRRNDLDDLYQKFSQLKRKEEAEVDRKLSCISGLLSDSRNEKLSQQIYRSCKSKCYSPKFRTAVSKLEKGQQRVREKSEENEGAIDNLKAKIRELEKEISSLHTQLLNE